MSSQTILIIGASRGIGRAMAAEFLKKDWNVIGTVRGEKRTLLHDLADSHRRQQGDSSSGGGSSLTIKQLDMCAEDQIARLRADLEQSNAALDMLFINAGTTNKDPTQHIGQVSTQEFIDVMVTNALSPMRVLESLQGFVRSPSGLLGIMSSGQGSLENNVAGQREVYRGTKAALNMYMKSFAAREMRKEQQEQGQGPRAMVLMAPGWIKTELGGAGARLTLEETIPSLVNVLLEKRARPGLEYLDYQGKTVPW
ncbi:hypothetical protein NQ176_g3638 [Zarea fungicola]|uniref:Uncharacterized protein n=1 Tax=Zarea fungicola TaxID=93591 RepID=A0ACC1NHI8_9HYPO|nr:hypothetical protein NQ176_g3638 [Lecanicillium fungicola]